MGSCCMRLPLCYYPWPPLRFLVSGSKDHTARIYSLDPIPGYVPVTLSGHRGSIVGAYFGGEGDVVYTISKDAAAFVWEWTERPLLPTAALQALPTQEDDLTSGVALSTTTAALASRTRFHAVPDPCGAPSSERDFSVLTGEWRLASKHFFNQDHAKVYSSTFHRGGGLLVVGFSSGVFGVYNMPECTVVHTLSISRHRIHSAAVNPTGEWLAFGSRTLGQLLVWEWQSESCASFLGLPVALFIFVPCHRLCVCVRHPEAAGSLPRFEYAGVLERRELVGHWG